MLKKTMKGNVGMISKKGGIVISAAILLLMLFLSVYLPSASYEVEEETKVEQTEGKKEDPKGSYDLLQSEVDKYTVTYEEIHESIPYETVEEPSEELPYLERALAVKGREGERVYLYEVRTNESGESTRTLLDTKTVLEPVNEVIYVGSDRAVPYNEFIYPTVGKITSMYGSRLLHGSSNTHYGLDIANAIGTFVVASDAGIVTEAGVKGTYGLCIIIDHGNGFVTCYAHLSKIKVEVGQRVARGEEIGESGSSGNATGNHLHFEIRKEGERVDPLSYLAGELLHE